MTKGQDAGAEPFALKYGAVEALLGELVGGRDNAIVTRFRKLRPKFAGDGILSETGSNVRYDLTRTLGICATFGLNSLGIPQGHAVDLVVANWPEIARACLIAWKVATGDDSFDDGTWSPVIRLYVDALNDAPRIGSWASLHPMPVPGRPHVTLDCIPIIDAIRDAAASTGQADRLASAFADIDRTFGWDALKETDPTRLPARPESGFFGTGPYFDRARVLVSVIHGTGLRLRERQHLQAILDYLESPPPIDAWKQFIGTEPGEPRLYHLLSAWGLELGLKSKLLASEILRGTGFPNDAPALDLIGRGEARIAELIEEARS